MTDILLSKIFVINLSISADSSKFQGGIQLCIFLYVFKVLEQSLLNDLLSNTLNS